MRQAARELDAEREDPDRAHREEEGSEEPKKPSGKGRGRGRGRGRSNQNDPPQGEGGSSGGVEKTSPLLTKEQKRKLQENMAKWSPRGKGKIAAAKKAPTKDPVKRALDFEEEKGVKPAAKKRSKKAEPPKAVSAAEAKLATFDTSRWIGAGGVAIVARELTTTKT